MHLNLCERYCAELKAMSENRLVNLMHEEAACTHRMGSWEKKMDHEFWFTFRRKELMCNARVRQQHKTTNVVCRFLS